MSVCFRFPEFLFRMWVGRSVGAKVSGTLKVSKKQRLAQQKCTLQYHLLPYFLHVHRRNLKKISPEPEFRVGRETGNKHSLLNGPSEFCLFAIGRGNFDRVISEGGSRQWGLSGHTVTAQNFDSQGCCGVSTHTKRAKAARDIKRQTQRPRKFAACPYTPTHSMGNFRGRSISKHPLFPLITATL